MSVATVQIAHELGPTGQRLQVGSALSDALIRHTQYMSSLSYWDLYIVWRYTNGSGQVNAFLLGFSDPVKLVIWVRQFFQYYNIEKHGIPSGEFRKFNVYFLNPAKFRMNEYFRDTAKQVMQIYISALQKIITNAPPLRDNVVVYKASNPYPLMPHELNSVPYSLPQVPFNSASYDPQMNYGMFLSSDSQWALFEIMLPIGSRVLFINPVYHSYPFEKEVLIPHSVIFDVYRIDNVMLDVVDRNNYKIDDAQITNNGRYEIGEAHSYQLRPGFTVSKRQMKMFSCVLRENKNNNTELVNWLL